MGRWSWSWHQHRKIVPPRNPGNSPQFKDNFKVNVPNEKISDEVSITSGYEYNSQNSIIATSGKSKYKFDIAQDNFAWISSNKIEKKIIKKMKKSSRIMVTAYNQSGSQTIDHYSLMGFTKAYNAAKKSCT